MGLNRIDHLVDATPLFLANSEPAHQGCQADVARPGWHIDEPMRVNQGFARIRKLNSSFEYFNHGSSPGHTEVLMNKHVCQQFPDGNFRIHENRASQTTFHHFIRGEQGHDEPDHFVKGRGIAATELQFPASMEPGRVSILNYAYTFVPQPGERGKVKSTAPAFVTSQRPAASDLMI